MRTRTLSGDIPSSLMILPMCQSSLHLAVESSCGTFDVGVITTGFHHAVAEAFQRRSPALVISTSCDKEQLSKSNEVDTSFSEIAALSSNSKINKVVLNRYSTPNGRVAGNFGKLLLENAEIGYSSSSNSVASVVPFTDGISSLVVLGNEDGTIHEEFIVSVTANSENFSEVKYYDVDGNSTISFSVVNGKIKNLVSESISGRVADWDSCTTCAVTSCGSDGGCTILCGLTGPWCLAAIAVACIDSDLEC